MNFLRPSRDHRSPRTFEVFSPQGKSFDVRHPAAFTRDLFHVGDAALANGMADPRLFSKAPGAHQKAVVMNHQIIGVYEQMDLPV